MVPVTNIVAITACLIASLLLPVVGWFIVWRRTRASIVNLLVGMGIFFVCYIIASITSAVGSLLIASPIVLTLVLSLRAGLVEEFARFIAFKWPLKRHNAIGDALMYGVGHGGMEVLLVYTLAMVNNLVFAAMANTGFLDVLTALAPDQADVLSTTVQALAAAGPWDFGIGLVERIAAMILHLSLSVIVFCAVRQRKWPYLVLAIALHTLADGSTALLVAGLLGDWALEAVFMAIALGTAAIAWRIARGYRPPAEPEGPGQTPQPPQISPQPSASL